MQKKTKSLATLSAVFFCTFLYFTPHIAVSGMKSAAEAKDATKLSSYVNYPALKENLKATFNAKMAANASKKQDPFGSLGNALAAAIIGPMIDALVTPENLTMMMAGDKPQLSKNSTNNQSTPSEIETAMSYESLDRFIVSVKKKRTSEEAIALVFNRDGLFSWKLSALRMPL